MSYLLTSGSCDRSNNKRPIRVVLESIVLSKQSIVFEMTSIIVFHNLIYLANMSGTYHLIMGTIWDFLIYFPIGSHIKLCPAKEAILDFPQCYKCYSIQPISFYMTQWIQIWCHMQLFIHSKLFFFIYLLNEYVLPFALSWLITLSLDSGEGKSTDPYVPSPLILLNTSGYFFYNKNKKYHYLHNKSNKKFSQTNQPLILMNS